MTVRTGVNELYTVMSVFTLSYVYQYPSLFEKTPRAYTNLIPHPRFINNPNFLRVF